MNENRKMKILYFQYSVKNEHSAEFTSEKRMEYKENTEYSKNVKIYVYLM